MNPSTFVPVVLGLATVLSGCSTGAGGSAAAEPPLPHPEFEQILPRGRIASVDDPVFVGAGEAEIDDDSWVLGVEVDGVAHAYSLNLLNGHEVVNDSINGKNFAAVW